MSGGSLTACCTPVNRGSITPTIVTGTLLTRTTLPTIEGSLPKRALQYFELITATGDADGVSSSGTIVRPMRVPTPSSW